MTEQARCPASADPIDHLMAPILASERAELEAVNAELLGAANDLFVGGFMGAGLRGEPSQWKSELAKRLAPLKAAIAKAGARAPISAGSIEG